MKTVFTRKEKYFAGLFLYFTVILFVYRIIFIVYYKTGFENAPLQKILKAFLVGFRFDFSVTAILLFPFFILSCLNFFNRFRPYGIFWSYGPLLISCWMTGHLAADVLYFENANKHIGYEGFVFLGSDSIIILKSALERNPQFLFFSVLGVLLIFSGSSILFSLFLRPVYQREKITRLLTGMIFGSLILLLLMRGGIQTSPIGPGNAIISENTYLNNLALNGVFTMFADFRADPVPDSQRVSLEESVYQVREEIKYPGAEFVSIKYPVLRKTIAKNAIRPPNIVLFIMESWTGKFIKPIAEGTVREIEVTPEFNSLARKGIFFTRFFATGGRTSNGLMSVLTGIPDRPGLSVIHSRHSLGRVSGLGNILKKAGYSTSFYYGGELAFENIKPILKHWGFDALFDYAEISGSGKYKTGAWGIDDADVYDFMHTRFQESKPDQPFLSVVLTLSTHYPYRVPSPEFAVFGKRTPESEYLNVMRYADWSIKDYLQKAEKSDYFRDTVFLFVSDHTHHKNLNYYEDRNIPFLIYSPGRFRPELRREISSQLDIIPTVLGIVGKEVYFSVMGRDLLNVKSRQSAYFAYGNIFGWVEGDTYFLDALDKSNALNFAINPPYREYPVCRVFSAPCIVPQRKARSFLTLSDYLLKKNLVFPAENDIPQK
ncbi:MAG: sulfatase-like hydrolase/transferase [Leptospira sp.]|nr:sulfatase-like hydrolase/transferase [Leptospira sp.]